MNEQAPTVTPSALRQQAKEICESYDRYNLILSEADATDLADENKLAALRDRLRQHEAKADADRLEDFQLTAALKMQLEAMTAKVTGDKLTRRTAAGIKARAAVAHVNLPAFFAAAFAAERTKAVAALGELMENELRASSMSAQMDNVNSLDMWCRELCIRLPGPVVAQRLKRFVAGEVPVWRV